MIALVRGATAPVSDGQPSKDDRQHTAGDRKPEIYEREHAATLLQGLGYRVRTAGNAAEALETLGDGTDIDLLFSDIVMPGSMDGRALGEEARRLRPGLKVLFASGYAPAGPGDAPGEGEAIGLLAKPYRRQDVAVRIRAVLEAP